MELQDWRAVGISVAGTSHAKTMLPCQDSHRLEIVDCFGQVVIMIASDGAGSASRSEQGSGLACERVLADVRKFLESGARLSDVTREKAREWVENAFVVIDDAAMQAELPVREFACTLLVALISDEHSVFLQIGDGAIVFWPRGDDDWCVMSWPQHGEYINTTVFMTDAAARDRFEFCSRADMVDEVAVFTDGIEALVLHYATHTVHSPFFDSIFPAVRSLQVSGISALLASQLGAYLDSPAICDRTDDDKTLLLASRLKPPSFPDTVLVESQLS